jgi:PEP-CTERM motif-containing protein
MRLLSTFAVLTALALPAAAHADSFTLTGSGGGFSGSATLAASNNNNGSFTITGISGAGNATGISLLAPGGFAGNDNLLFPSASSVLDAKGFAFSDTVGNTSFKVDVAAAAGGGYQASFLDNDGNGATLPVTFSLARVGATPEPGSWILMGTGVLGLAGLMRRKISLASGRA